jgi:orotate phosphoribosyltransferase
MQNLQVARALLEIEAVGFSPHAPVTFKSGIVSPVYVDSRRLPYHPVQWRLVVEAFKALAERLAFDVIAGVAVGGIPHSSALAYLMYKPSVFVRSEAKEHGKKKLVEGGDVNNKHVLLVEDVVTTGGSSLQTVASLREAGAMTEHMLAIVSYEFAESKEAFATADVKLHTLTNFSVITQAALDMGKFSNEEMNIINDWFHDPHGWAARHGFA